MSVSEMRGSAAAAKTPDIAEPVIGRRLAPTRWRIRATVAVPQGEQTRTRPRITSTPSQARLLTLTAAARRIRIAGDRRLAALSCFDEGRTANPAKPLCGYHFSAKRL